MSILKVIKLVILGFFTLFLLNACNGKLPGGDARKFPDDPALRVKKNLEEGRGFKLMDATFLVTALTIMESLSRCN